MKNLTTRSNPGSLSRLGQIMLCAAGTFVPAMASQALPIFPLPGVPPHPAGFVTHLAPTGPIGLVPGGTIGPIFYGDGLASPDLHHWEIEIFNPLAGVVATFNVNFVLPTGVVSGSVILPGMSSVYFDMHVLDIPPEIGPWVIGVSSSTTMPIPVLVDQSVIEYPFATGAMPGLGGFLSSSAAAVFGPPLPGAPDVTFDIRPVPAPGAFALLGLAGLIGITRRRRS